MKSFSQPTSLRLEPQSPPAASEHCDQWGQLPVPGVVQVGPVDCSATTITEMSYREILIMPTVWLWHGNLVIFGTNLIEKLKVEERPAQYDRSGLLVKKAEYVIEGQYSLGGKVGQLNWHIACDAVSTRTIFFFGEKGKDSFWFIPSVNSRTRVFANQSPNADKLLPPWVNTIENAGSPNGTEDKADSASGGEVTATYAILLHMQSTNLPKATQLFEQLALEAKHQAPQNSSVMEESEINAGRIAHAVNLKKNQPLEKEAQLRRSYVRG